jgi:hypothetical protein
MRKICKERAGKKKRRRKDAARSARGANVARHEISQVTKNPQQIKQVIQVSAQTANTLKIQNNDEINGKDFLFSL